MAASRTVFVAGAGIGGLTASLALAGKGFRVVIIEKSERLEEIGAGLQLSPNASRILIDLGLQPRLAERAVIPDAISLMSARSGGEVVRLPLGDAATLHKGAPYWVVHRADLQAALQAHVTDNPDIELRLGCEIVRTDRVQRDGINLTRQTVFLQGEQPAGMSDRRGVGRGAPIRMIRILNQGIVRERIAVEAVELPAGSMVVAVSLGPNPTAFVAAGAVLDAKAADVSVFVERRIVRIEGRVVPGAADADERSVDVLGNLSDDLTILDVRLESLRREETVQIGVPADTRSLFSSLACFECERTLEAGI